MKKLLGILTVVVLFGIIPQANAIPTTLIQSSDDYVGLINDGIPSNEANEVIYINHLIGLSPGAGDTVIGTETYNRTGSTLTDLPNAILSGSTKDETGTTSINATGFEYVLGKYDASDAGSLVWYLGENFSGTVELQEALNGKALSHISLYNSVNTPVPEPATMLLLGTGLIGFAGVSRKKLFKK